MTLNSVPSRTTTTASVQKSAARNGQYTLKRILGLWAVAALPTALLAWVVAPALIPHAEIPPALLYWALLTIGAVWQLAVSLWIVRREEGDLHWSTLRRRAWLNVSRHPHTGEPRIRFFWWLLPCLFVAFVALGLGTLLSSFPVLIAAISTNLDLPHLRFLTFLRQPTYANVFELAGPQFAGQWPLVGAALLTWALSALFAEEFLFRGLLLPKMQGVFGKWDWSVNAVLYALYHLHRPWTIPFRLIGALAIVWPARRFRSNWMAVIGRGLEGAGVLAVTLLGVLAPTPEPLPSSLTLPRISRRPPPMSRYRWPMTSLPTYDPDSGRYWQVDLRSYDLGTCKK